MLLPTQPSFQLWHLNSFSINSINDGFDPHSLRLYFRLTGNVVAYTLNPSIWELEAGRPLSEATPVYKVSFSPAKSYIVRLCAVIVGLIQATILLRPHVCVFSVMSRKHDLRAGMQLACQHRQEKFHFFSTIRWRVTRSQWLLREWERINSCKSHSFQVIRHEGMHVQDMLNGPSRFYIHVYTCVWI